MPSGAVYGGLPMDPSKVHFWMFGGGGGRFSARGFVKGIT